MSSQKNGARWFAGIVNAASEVLLVAMLAFFWSSCAYAQADRYRCIPDDGGPSYTTSGGCRGDAVRREPMSREEIAEAWQSKNRGRAFIRCTAADHSYSFFVRDDEACPSGSDTRTTEYVQKSTAQIQRDQQVVDAAVASLERDQSRGSPVADSPAPDVQPEVSTASARMPESKPEPSPAKPKKNLGWLVLVVFVALVVFGVSKWRTRFNEEERRASSSSRRRTVRPAPETTETPSEKSADMPVCGDTDMNRKARELLAVLENSGLAAGIPGGLAFAAELQQARLDYSLPSLDRVDQLLDRIKAKLAPDRAAWQKQPPAENFCLLLAFYLGTVISRHAKMPMQWCTRAQAAALMPPDMPLPDADWSRLVGVIAASPCVPLGVIEDKLFGDAPSGMGCRAYTERFLGKLKTVLPDDMDENQRCAIMLEAFFGDTPLHGGLAYQGQLKQARLDYSLPSLQRLDQLLRFLQPEIKLPPVDFINRPETQNFMRLLAFYIGMTIAKQGKISVKWLDFAQAKKDMPELEFGFETSSVCLLGGRVYFPLGLVAEILLQPNAQRSVPEWARQALQAAPPPIPSILQLSMQNDVSAPMDNWLQAAIEKAGFVAALGMFMVEGGATGTPMVFVPGEDGTGTFRDFGFYEDGDAAFKDARKLMDDNPDAVLYQVLSFDGYANLHSGRTDALTIELRVYCAKPRSGEVEFGMTVVCPYRNANDPKGFAIYSPKLSECSGSEAMHESIFKHFYLGVTSYKAEKFDWFKYLDESI